jgi:ribosome-binding protein aMBF1 (putative translation factor)
MSDCIDITKEAVEAAQKMTVGNRVEVFRLCEELSQEQLADACNIPVNIIRGIEADLIDIRPYKKKICDVLMIDEGILDIADVKRKESRCKCLF